MERMTQGECLRMLRKQEGLSLRQVQKLTGISYGYLSSLEQGKHRISLDYAHALMELYGGSLKILANLPQEPRNKKIFESPHPSPQNWASVWEFADRPK